MPRGQSVPPVSQDDRTTERRLVPSVPAGLGASHGGEGSLGAESSREVHQEDFLFHLFRGSELLQENRVLEAKEQLEFALTMQPSDPKGQDLLAAVYFRLGLYPHAIQIYEGLEAAFPNDTSIKNNLALGYLKTGQPERAKRALQDAVRLNPEHKRAWGYLGLALQKLGELEQAQIAFERGGHALMAKRVTERRLRGNGSMLSDPPPIFDGDVQSVAQTAFSELDAGDLRFSLAEPTPPRPPDGMWHALEPGDAARGSLFRSAPPGALVASPEVIVPPHSASTRLVPPAMPIAPPAQTGDIPSLLSSLEGHPLSLLPNGVAVATAPEDAPIALRLEALRVAAGTITTRVLHRRLREAETSEVMGGLGSPLVRVTGGAHVLVGARPGHALAMLTLDGEIAFVREESLVAFELRLTYENGRVALDPPGEGRGGEAVHVAQLRGTGAILLETSRTLARLPCIPSRPLLVRREWVVAWLGRLVPRAVPPSDSPGGQRGLVAFSGEGALLVSVS